MRRFFPLFAAVVSVLCGALQFFLFKAYFSPMDRYQKEVYGKEAYDTEAYALLTVDESYHDRHIQELLSSGGIQGTVSESSIEIPIDDFGFLRMIPLDGFYGHIESFDPRDTGFASRLSSFFVHEGKRFFFIPLAGISESGVTVSSQAQMSAHIDSLLNDIPFTLATVAYERSSFPIAIVYAVLLAAACACALYFSRSRRLFLFVMPLLPAFFWCGTWAFLFAALLLGTAELLREPLKELLVNQSDDRHRVFSVSYLRKILAPCKLTSLFIALIAGIVALVAVLRFHVVPFASVYVTFSLSMLLAFRLEAVQARENRHVPFVPVQMLATKLAVLPLFKVLAPFGAASLLALLVPLFSPEFQSVRGEVFPLTVEYLVTEEEYLGYAEFQRTFSYRALGRNYETYTQYHIDDDGLVLVTEESPLNLWEIPEFPLEKLNAFLLNYGILSGTHSSADMARY